MTRSVALCLVGLLFVGLVLAPAPVSAEAGQTALAAREPHVQTTRSVATFENCHFFLERPHLVTKPESAVKNAVTDGTWGEMSTVESTSQNGSDLLLPAFIFLVVVVLVGFVARQSGVPFRFRGDDTERTTGEVTGKAGADTESTLIPEEERIPDDDRVRTLLEDNDGRMKQVTIVDETDWSKSKVSMLLSKMEDEGNISKLRVGRENIISLAGHEPDAAGSPFDDEDWD